MTQGRGRLTRIVLEGEALHRLSALQEADRDQAVEDLREENSFFPTAQPELQSILHLSIQQGRLVLDIRDAEDKPVLAVMLAMGPFKMLIKDYQMLLDFTPRPWPKGARRVSRPSTWAAAACTTKARS